MNYDILMGKLREKLDANYQEYLNRSAAWSLRERRDHAEEIQDTELAYGALLNEGGTEPELRYLLHFKDPLRIVADQMAGQRVLGCPEGESALEHALWRIFDTRDADSQYELEEAFQPPEGDAEELLAELAGRARAEYQEYLKGLTAQPKTALIQKSAETADMGRLLSAFENDSYDVPAADLCFICRAVKPLQAFQDFLYQQEELSALDAFDSILTAYNQTCEEAVLMGARKAAAPAEVSAPMLADEPEDRAQLLQQRMEAEYETLEKDWLLLQPAELIEKAQEIAGSQLVLEALSGYDFQEEDLEILLRFPDPLSKVAGYWSGADSPTAEEVGNNFPYIFSSIAENEPWSEEPCQGQTGEPALC